MLKKQFAVENRSQDNIQYWIIWKGKLCDRTNSISEKATQNDVVWLILAGNFKEQDTNKFMMKKLRVWTHVTNCDLGTKVVLTLILWI